MKTNVAIEASKQRVLAWGEFFLATFGQLGISNNKVIKNCHIGRRTFYRMKHGELINADAYIRLSRYAWEKVQEKEAKLMLPFGYKGEWIKELIKKLLLV